MIATPALLMDARTGIARIKHLFAMTGILVLLTNVKQTERALTLRWIVMITTPVQMTDALREIALTHPALVMMVTLALIPIAIPPPDAYSLQ